MNEQNNIAQIFNALAYFDLYPDQLIFEKLNKGQWYKLAYDQILQSPSFEGTKAEDLTKWNLTQIRQALQKVSQESEFATTPEKEILDSRMAEEKQQIDREARARAQAQVATFKKQQVRQINPVVLEPTTPITPISLKPEEGILIQKTGQIAQQNPEVFIQSFIENALKPENLPPETSPEVVQAIAPMVAQDLIQKLEKIDTTTPPVQITPPINPVWVANNFADPNNPVLSEAYPDPQQRQMVAQQVQNLTAASATLHDLSGEIVSSQYPFFQALYGKPKKVEFKQVNQPTANSITVDLNSLVSFANEYEKIRLFRIEQLNINPTAASQFLKEDFGTVLRSLPSPSFSQAANFVSSVSSFVFESPTKPVATGVLSQIPGALRPELFSSWKAVNLLNSDALILIGHRGINMGVMTQISPALSLEVQLFPSLAFSITPTASVATGAAATATTTAAATTGAAAAGTVAAETATVATTAAAGTAVAPVVGTIIGAVVGLVVQALPAVFKWIKEHSEDLAIGSGAVLLSGIFLGSVPLMVLGGGVLGGVAFTGAGIATLRSAAGGMANLFGVGLATSFSEIVIPLIISLLSLPVLIGLIMFIINSGAYIVPGTTTTTSGGACIQSCWPADGPITQDDWDGHLVYNLPSLGGQGTAVDIGCNYGAPVYAPVSGVITYYTPGSGPLGPKDGAGYYIIIKSNQVNVGLFHLVPFGNQAPPLTSGSSVEAGQIVGYCDSTGNNTGGHVHYEAWGLPIRSIVPPNPPLVVSTVSHPNVITPENRCSEPTTACVGGLAGEGPVSWGNLSGWLIESTPSNVRVTTRGENTCSWAESEGLAAAVNANFFDAAGVWGLAKQDLNSTNNIPERDSLFYSFLITVDGSGKIDRNPPEGSNLSSVKSAVSGTRFGDLPDDSRPRTVLALKNQTLYLIHINSATPDELVEALEGQDFAIVDDGGREALMLDGGNSTKIYTTTQGCKETDSGRQVPVSIGVRGGKIREIKPQ